MRHQVPNRTRLPNSKGKLREGRRKAQADLRELCSLVKIWKGFKRTPTIEKALTGKHISQKEKMTRLTRFIGIQEWLSTSRQSGRRYLNPCLAGGETKPFPTLERAKEERRRRDAERGHFEKLSHYYQREGGSWQRRLKGLPLVKEGKHRPDR